MLDFRFICPVTFEPACDFHEPSGLRSPHCLCSCFCLDGYSLASLAAFIVGLATFPFLGSIYCIRTLARPPNNLMRLRSFCCAVSRFFLSPHLPLMKDFDVLLPVTSVVDIQPLCDFNPPAFVLLYALFPFCLLLSVPSRDFFFTLQDGLSSCVCQAECVRVCLPSSPTLVCRINMSLKAVSLILGRLVLLAA